MKKRSALLLFLLLCACVTLLLQALLVPKYMTSVPEGALISEYYQNAGSNDCIFIGDCEVYENFSPVTLWEEYGISSCIRGSPQQLIWQSYYLMEETFHYETPRVMVFNVLSMKYGSPESTGSQAKREAYNRMTLDGMRFSGSKLRSILASMTETEREQGAFFSYLFPLLRYHDRWSGLTAEDLTYWLRRDTVSVNGYLMQTGVVPYTAPHPEPPPESYAFSQTCWTYLDKMAALCAEHGTQLVLIKAPSLSPVWYGEWDSQIRAWAEEKGIPYLNLLEYQQEIGIDWSQDTYDAGLHLNVSGAEKAARFLGGILSEEFGLPDRRSDEALRALWEEKRAAYHAEKSKGEPS